MIRHFSQIYFCDAPQEFIQAYNDCMKGGNFKNLVVNFSVHHPPHLRLYSNLAEAEGPTVFYVKKK